MQDGALRLAGIRGLAGKALDNPEDEPVKAQLIEADGGRA